MIGLVAACRPSMFQQRTFCGGGDWEERAEEERFATLNPWVPMMQDNSRLKLGVSRSGEICRSGNSGVEYCALYLMTQIGDRLTVYDIR